MGGEKKKEGRGGKETGVEERVAFRPAAARGGKGRTPVIFPPFFFFFFSSQTRSFALFFFFSFAKKSPTHTHTTTQTRLLLAAMSGAGNAKLSAGGDAEVRRGRGEA